MPVCNSCLCALAHGLAATTKEIVNTALTTNRLSLINFPQVITEKMKLNYDLVRAFFSTAEGISLEHYIINRKIDLVKAMLKVTDPDVQQNPSLKHIKSTGNCISAEFSGGSNFEVC